MTVNELIDRLSQLPAKDKLLQVAIVERGEEGSFANFNIKPKVVGQNCRDVGSRELLDEYVLQAPVEKALKRDKRYIRLT